MNSGIRGTGRGQDLPEPSITWKDDDPPPAGPGHLLEFFSLRLLGITLVYPFHCRAGLSISLPSILANLSFRPISDVDEEEVQTMESSAGTCVRVLHGFPCKAYRDCGAMPHEDLSSDVSYILSSG